MLNAMELLSVFFFLFLGDIFFTISFPYFVVPTAVPSRVDDLSQGEVPQFELNCPSCVMRTIFPTY